MSEHISAAGDIRNLARLFKNMEKAADLLEAVGTLDQAQGEKKKILADLDAQIVARQADIVTQFGEIERAKEDAKLVTQQAKTKAEDAIQKANNTIAELIFTAQADAAYAKSSANLAAENILTDARIKAQVCLGQAEASRIQSDALTVQIAEQNAELKRVTDAITAARATMAQIMGNAK